MCMCTSPWSSILIKSYFVSLLIFSHYLLNTPRILRILCATVAEIVCAGACIMCMRVWWCSSMFNKRWLVREKKESVWRYPPHTHTNQGCGAGAGAGAGAAGADTFWSEPEPEPEPPKRFARSRSRSRSRKKNGAAPAPKRDTIVEK